MECPKCKSNNIQKTERGFKAGRAVWTSLIFTPVGGAILGMVGRRNMVNQCQDCGKLFKIKKD